MLRDGSSLSEGYGGGSPIEATWFKFDNVLDDARYLIEMRSDMKNAGLLTQEKRQATARAVVVLTVAAWQAYVQDLVAAILAVRGVPLGDPIRQAADEAVERFATPDAKKTAKLLKVVGFDPRPAWDSLGEDKKTPTPNLSAIPKITDATKRMNEWLRVRHAIAHGDELPADLSVVSLEGQTPTLTVEDAKACMSFFLSVVRRTTAVAVETV